MIASIGMLLRQRFPNLSFRLFITDDPASAARLGSVDMAIHFGEASPDGPWVSMEIAHVRRWLIASPDYLSTHGTPQAPEDLLKHELLCWALPSESATALPLRGGGSQPITPAVVSSDIHTLRVAASLGMGIAFVPDAMLPDLGPPLVPVLAEQVGDQQAVRVLIPSVLEEAPRIRAVIQELRRFRVDMGLFSSP